jgi:ribonuclease P protein component
MPVKQFTLSQNERLKSRKQIEILFRQGNNFNLFPLRASYLISTGVTEEPLQFGVGVSGRWFKKAVDRNRVKRLIRESWRLQKNDLKQMLAGKQLHMIVFLVYTGKELPEFMTIKEGTSSVIDRLSRIIHETTVTNT